MFCGRGIQPVTVVFNNTKNCFLHLPSQLVLNLSLNENQALELSWSHGSTVFLSWTQIQTSSFNCNQVELCRQLGERLGLKDGEQGFLKLCHQVSSVHQVFVEPLTADDWEILELHSAALEQQLLDQIRVVFQDAVFPVWVDNHTVIYIQIASLTPSVCYGRLEQFTELVVSPKRRTGFGDVGASAVRTRQIQHPLCQSDLPPPSGPPLESTSPGPQSQQRSGIADLTNLLRCMIKGMHDPVKELPPVPDIPALLTDALYRVCGEPPDCLCTISHSATAVIHLFPWSCELNGSLTQRQAQLTYGLLSKVPSPKEVKDRAKQATEKKRNTGVSNITDSVDGRQDVKAEPSTVVRVVIHNVDKLHGYERSPSKGAIHCGRVWIPPPLVKKLSIVPHSTVRIKPVKSTVKVASSIQLQPLKPLGEETDEAIQTAFLGWLHTQCHQPLHCLTARSGSLLLHGVDAKLEFALTVLRPAAETDPPDQLFLLAPSTIHKKDIQVDREPVTMSAMKAESEPMTPELPCLSTLGGVDELSSTGFEFISHSLLGSPLSRELGAPGQGLQGGALLVTGPKGGGKSSLSRALCRKAREDLDAHVEVVDCKKLQGKRAETVRQLLQDIFALAEWMQPSVVLLDDLDHVAAAPTSSEHEEGTEALLQMHIAQSLKDVVDEVIFHGSLVCLILTSQSEHSLHPLLTLVQGCHFIQGFARIQPPDQAERAEILRQVILKKSGLSEETLQTLDLAAVARETEGYVSQDLVLLVERAVHASVAQRGQSDLGVCPSLRDFEQALRGFTPPSLWGANLHTPTGFGLERVGGLTEVRQELMDTILLPAQYPALFANLPIRHRSGILLYGAPGTGKTLLARAVAKDSGMNFISIKGPELLSKYIGASEQGVRDVFQRAQAAKPCILFFDEFDSLAPRRGHDSTGVTDRVVNQLLTQLDGVEGLEGVYVIAASSRPDLIDPALLRPGRLDKSLYCPPPGPEDRLEILKALSVDVPLAADVDLEQLAAVTDQFTGADLKALLYNAQLEAVNSILDRSSPHELMCCSDSEMSLSSMMFPNHSSGSDDSVGEGDAGAGLDRSVHLLETTELRADDDQHDGKIWRIYFGSSYESEDSPISGLNSFSATNSITHEFTGLSGRDPSSLLPPAYMPSLQRGYEELSPEQLERLQQDINSIKKNYRRVSGECVPVCSGSSQHDLLLCQAHVTAALAVTRPSVSRADWSRYTKLYEAFGGSEAKESPQFKPGHRVTLA